MRRFWCSLRHKSNRRPGGGTCCACAAPTCARATSRARANPNRSRARIGRSGWSRIAGSLQPTACEAPLAPSGRRTYDGRAGRPALPGDFSSLARRIQLNQLGDSWPMSPLLVASSLGCARPAQERRAPIISLARWHPRDINATFDRLEDRRRPVGVSARARDLSAPPNFDLFMAEPSPGRLRD